MAVLGYFYRNKKRLKLLILLFLNKLYTISHFHIFVLGPLDRETLFLRIRLYHLETSAPQDFTLGPLFCSIFISDLPVHFLVLLSHTELLVIIKAYYYY